MPKVSVIVPIYNAETYLDECINSIIEQTFKDIEILLVVQMGQDRSLEISRRWEKKDKRVRVIVKAEKDRGLGPARNTGVDVAEGEYVAFVDADDTIAATFVELMYNAITEKNADIAECNYFRVQMNTGKKEYMQCNCIMGKELNIAERVQLGSVAIWKLMIKKDFLVRKKISQPNVFSEDVATYLFIICNAKNVANVNEGIYFYRRGSGSSISNQGITYEKLLDAFDALTERFRESGIYQNRIKEIQIYIRRWMSRNLSLALLRLNDNEYNQCVESFRNYYERNLGKTIKGEVILGSFNLSRIVNKMEFIEDPYNRINFSSIISIVNQGTYAYEIKHRNPYREIMLNRERDKVFWHILEKAKPEFLFLDLLEERHDIIRLKDRYITKSDAFDEALTSIGNDYRIIKRDSDEARQLWENSVRYFMNEIKKRIPLGNIIVVENYLTENFSDGYTVTQYGNIDEIRKMNRILKEYYSFIKNNYVQITVIGAYKTGLYCTDENYEFGCYPWHLNEWANIEIAELIQKEFMDGKL